MTQKFEVARFKRLMSADRRRRLPPERILSEIGLGPGQTFVDIGAGPGYFTIPAAKIIGPKGRAFGLDISPVMVRELTKNARRAGAVNVRAMRAAETAKTLPRGADFYFMANVFHEVEDRSAYLRRIRTSMSAHSRFVIIDYLKKKMKHGPPLAERVSFRSIRPILVNAGFVIERVFRPDDEEYGIIARRK